MAEFPKDFLWGAAASAYQVEGNNSNTDWWEWEKKTGLPQVSGLACRHYELYRQDFELARSLGHNSHRLSLEWSRIQPGEHRFQDREINHYLEVISSLRELQIEPVVSLHHFTNPIWFAGLGGWENRKAPGYFLEYVERIVTALCGKIKFWVTINEPMVYVYLSYILGCWPPQKKSFFKADKVAGNLFFAHLRAYRLIHEIYKKRGLPPPAVSIAQNLQYFMACQPSLRNSFAAYLRNRIFNFDLLNRLAASKALDFIGINYYTRSLVETSGWGVRSLLLDVCKGSHSRLPKNSLGWDVYPEGLYNLLLRLKRYNLAVFILENGICTHDDGLRSDFIYSHLKSIHSAMDKGVRVMGYLYWSLLDNYEWDKGFDPRFGLIEVDYRNYKRTIRESARKLAAVSRTGTLSAWNG